MEFCLILVVGFMWFCSMGLSYLSTRLFASPFTNNSLFMTFITIFLAGFIVLTINRLRDISDLTNKVLTTILVGMIVLGLIGVIPYYMEKNNKGSSGSYDSSSYSYSSSGSSSGSSYSGSSYSSSYGSSHSSSSHYSSYYGSSHSSSHSSSSYSGSYYGDPYDVYSYHNAEDFADDWSDHFNSWEAAEDYWDDNY